MNEHIFRQQLQVMLAMQDAMNRMVAEDWQQRGFAWHRAIYQEGAELLDHLGTWPWWKKGKPDLPQARMELVDIWHFGLSWLIEGFGQPIGSEALASAIVQRVSRATARYSGLTYEQASDELRHAAVDQLMAAAGQRLFDTDAFFQLVYACGMTSDDLYRMYVGKNVLNRLRQRNGYKLGTYIKTWDGEEDNIHLERLLQLLPTDEQLPVRLEAELQSRYDNVKVRGNSSVPA